MKNQKKKNFAFQIGHIEIGKIMKFGGIWGQIWGSPPPPTDRVNGPFISFWCNQLKIFRNQDFSLIAFRLFFDIFCFFSLQIIGCQIHSYPVHYPCFMFTEVFICQFMHLKKKCVSSIEILYYVSYMVEWLIIVSWQLNYISNNL